MHVFKFPKDLIKCFIIIFLGNEAPFLAESDLPECARLSGRSADGKSASELEDQQIAEAMGRSQTEMKKEEPKNKDISPEDKFTEENVQNLMSYGFPRDKCIEELKASNGDVTQATAALFAKSIRTPN